MEIIKFKLLEGALTEINISTYTQVWNTVTIYIIHSSYENSTKRNPNDIQQERDEKGKFSDRGQLWITIAAETREN